jgi:hypothetical protein
MNSLSATAPCGKRQDRPLPAPTPTHSQQLTPHQRATRPPSSC